jgi:hypothetical protein
MHFHAKCEVWMAHLLKHIEASREPIIAIKEWPLPHWASYVHPSASMRRGACVQNICENGSMNDHKVVSIPTSCLKEPYHRLGEAEGFSRRGAEDERVKRDNVKDGREICAF